MRADKSSTKLLVKHELLLEGCLSMLPGLIERPGNDKAFSSKPGGNQS
ncbi:hypothetical protein SPSIL_002070 [Sporomusa silvacetica DSM 10669]|uniref:Uncharacterized protein n=1 Tax=Sporomusa silvacetica DSM 10669 TaxID=1123289 RepID=A0ABZ3IEL1_9FIRM|nr:hypothetical protein [Sporomusa silvacetica]OZC17891.1 hypothetical protein SPSIL_30310 [Sporomusa silvacetica DSM 10669]